MDNPPPPGNGSSFAKIKEHDFRLLLLGAARVIARLCHS
jgi:hypothetical protein